MTYTETPNSSLLDGRTEQNLKRYSEAQSDTGRSPSPKTRLETIESKNTRRDLYIGIDPGIRGGVCALREDGTLQDLFVLPVVDGTLDVFSLAFFLTSCKDRIAMTFVEEPIAMPRQSVKSTLSSGKMHGAIRAVVDLCGAGFMDVSPKEWQREILGTTKGTSDKGLSITTAQGIVGRDVLIPKNCRVPHDGLADAVCIAEYARRLYGGKRCWV